MAADEQRLEGTRQNLQIVARVLRHEVGDLLQTVYSTVAILHDRLPAGQDAERQLLADMKARAEHCRDQLDAVVDLIVPFTLSPAPVDLAQLVSTLVLSCRGRFPALQVHYEAGCPATVYGDARRLAQIGVLVLFSACRAAQRQLRVEVLPEPGGTVAWTVCDDGVGATSAQLTWLAQPFTTTQNAPFGLGLALARRVVDLHGGRVEAEVLPGGGCRVRIVLPAARPDSPGASSGPFRPS